MTLTADDRLEILELAHRVETSYDEADLGAFLACFTEDGVLDQGDYGSYQGVAELTSWWANFQRVFFDKRHLVTNARVSETTDGAELFYYFTVIERGQGPFVWGTATFTDQVVKQGGRWLVRYAKQDFDPNNGAGPGRYLFGDLAAGVERMNSTGTTAST